MFHSVEKQSGVRLADEIVALKREGGTSGVATELFTKAISVSQGNDDVLLLQGPVGPFFSILQDFFLQNGVEAWRVCFNAGDYFYSKKNKRLMMLGGEDSWRAWLKTALCAGQFGVIILFGSERPQHKIAREIAARYGVRVISLEEGYIRPGYISVEEGGNNNNSPISQILPPDKYEVNPDQKPIDAHKLVSTKQMVFHAMNYYTIRGIFSYGRQREMFHRTTPLVKEALLWTRNLVRRMLRGQNNFDTIQNLLEHYNHAYYLVPLQVANDSNLTRASLGWCSEKLISETIRSFASSAPSETRLVFKIHPMERGHNTLTPLILQTAELFDVKDRVDVIEIGSMGLLTRHAKGMITINSTSGLSAIFHGTSVLVMGDAFYAHPKLVKKMNKTADLDGFWSSHHVAPQELRKKYIEWVKQSALMTGDFYSSEGMSLACDAVFSKYADVKNNATQPAEEKIAI